MDTVGDFVAIDLDWVMMRDDGVIIGPINPLETVASIAMGGGETQNAWTLGEWTVDPATGSATVTVTSLSTGKPRAHFRVPPGLYSSLVVLSHTLTSTSYTTSGTEFPEFSGLGASGNRPYAYISTTNGLAGRFIASQVDMELPGTSGTRPATPLTFPIPPDGTLLNFFLNASDFGGATGQASFTIRLER